MGVGHVGRVGSDIGVEPADYGAQVFQRMPPTAVSIVRHQGDEHGNLLLRWGLRHLTGKVLRKLYLWRDGSQPVDFRQCRNFLQ